MEFIKKLVKVQAVVLAAVMVYHVLDLWATHTRLQALVQAWEAEGPHTSVVGQLRARLAALHWLGPLRPNPPRDPFKDCAIPLEDNDWWSFLQRVAAARGRLACLEEHMATARAEHGHLEDRLFSLYMVATAVVIVVCCLLCVLYMSAKSPGSSPSRGKKEEASSTGSFEIVELPRDGHSSSVSEMEAARLTWRWPLDMMLLSPRVISAHERLREVMKAAVLRRRRQVEGQFVPRDPLHWWRGADDGRGRLVIQPWERRGEVLRPYPYPRVPSVEDPWAFLHPRPRPSGLQQQQSQDKATPCPLASRWTVFSKVLTALQALLLAYLCLRGVAAR